MFAGLRDPYPTHDFEEDGVYDLVICGARLQYLVILLTYHFYRKLESRESLLASRWDRRTCGTLRSASWKEERFDARIEANNAST